MKNLIGLAAAAALLIYGVSASGEGAAPVQAPVTVVQAQHSQRLDWSAFTPALPPSPAAAPAPSTPLLPAAPADAGEIDVVDAHWMALTMWGEARREGEIGMRAVGHVIDNRRRSGRHGDYATDTVSEAYQFSCWNAGDPNRRAMENVDRLRPDGGDYQAWQDAKRIAAEILAGRSADPTGGARFYHSIAVAPAWSRGIEPVRRIGSHLFFVTAR